MSGPIERQIATALARFNKSAFARSERTLDAFSVLLKYEIQQSLSKPGTGKLYKVRKGKGYVGKAARALGPAKKGGRITRTAGGRIKMTMFHRASKPGESPAPDTNTLKRSAFVERTGVLQRAVGVAARYAYTLEFRMNRPFMVPALQSALAKLNIPE